MDTFSYIEPNDGHFSYMEPNDGHFFLYTEMTETFSYIETNDGHFFKMTVTLFLYRAKWRTLLLIETNETVKLNETNGG